MSAASADGHAQRRIALLFPGQGAEEPGMGLFATARSPRAAALLDRASAAAGADLRRAIARGGAALAPTQLLQPALVAASLAIAAALEEAGVQPVAVAGHSLGELAAWAAAGGIEPEAAVDLAALRGRLMAREAERRPGAMLALLRCDAAGVERAFEEGREAGVLAIAGWNAPDHCVLSGERAAIAAASSALPSPSSQLLPATGAWHSPLMSGAVEELRAALRAAPRGPLRARLAVNRTGELLDGGDDLPDLLAEQLVRPFQWARCLAALAALGVTDWVTVGPGRVLRGLVRHTLGRAAEVHTTEDERDLARTLEALAR